MQQYYYASAPIKKATPAPKKKKGNRLIIAALIMFFIITIPLAAIHQFAGKPSLSESVQWTVEYHVQEGDTLWDIATRIAGAEKHDTREMVYAIRSYNNLSSSSLSIGQGLMLPDTWEVK